MEFEFFKQESIKEMLKHIDEPFTIILQEVVLGNTIDGIFDLENSFVIDDCTGMEYRLIDFQLENSDKDFINAISFIVDRKYIFDSNYRLDNNDSYVYYHSRYCFKYVIIHIVMRILSKLIRTKARKALEHQISNIRKWLFNVFEISSDPFKLEHFNKKEITNYFKNFEIMEEYDRIVLLNAEEKYSFLKPLEERIIKSVSLRMDRIEERMDRIEERMDRIEERMDRIEERMDRIEERMDRIEERMDRIESQMSCVISLLQQLLAK